MSPTPFTAGPGIAIRTPLLSFDEILGWSEERPSVQEPRASFIDVWRRPEVREALFLASPKLESQLDDWIAGDRDAKVTRSLIRYFLRMSSRPTPFGLFAGCATGEIGDGTKIVLSEPAAHARKTRLDSHHLSALSVELERDGVLRRQLRFVPNSSLYRAAGRWRYAEATTGDTRRYHLVAVEPSDELDAVLAWAQRGASIDELAGSLVDDDVSRDEAEAFIGELIASQILVSELSPAVTGGEAIADLIATLRAASDDRALALEEVAAVLDEIDRSGGTEPDAYRAVADRLDPLGVRPDMSRLFQVDMVPDVEARVDPTTIEIIGSAVSSLARMMPAGRQGALDEFGARFAERYGTDEVPLAEVLDEEAGIGFQASTAPAAGASPLLAGLPFPARHDPPHLGGRRHDHLLRRLTEVWTTGATELVLSDQDVEALSLEEEIELPDAFSAMVTLGPDPERVAALHGVSGPSGATLLGRFCHADPRMEELVRAHLRAEEALRPGAVFAEIVHLPEGRTGNVIARPVLREFEIPFLGRSGAPNDRQIRFDDLMISLRGDRIFLRSKVLDREVIPRLTSAHNYSTRSLGVYRFLCSLQHQDCAGGVVWRWGAFEAAPFLPRVVLDRVVVARARWSMEGRTLDSARSEGRKGIVALRERLRLPRFVALQDGDNELMVDLENEASVDTFLELVRDRPIVTVVEMWPRPDDLLVQGPSGRHTHEVIVPFVRSASVGGRPPAGPARSGEAVRRYVPGSEWLYAKLYAGASGVEDILRRVVRPLVDTCRENGIDNWFFVRYGDPEWHLRLRFQGDPNVLSSIVLADLKGRVEEEMASGRSWRMQLDTYEREVERYGGSVGMDLCERWFTADSEAALSIIVSSGGDAGADLRWKLALAGVDALFSDLGFDLDQRISITARLARGYEEEFGADVDLKRSIGSRFREQRKDLEALLEERVDAFVERSHRARSVVEELIRAERAGDLQIPLPEVAISLAHMHVDRMLRSEHRAHELVIYTFLERLYRAREGRRRAPG